MTITARRRIAAANWKMYKTAAEARLFLEHYIPRLHDGEPQIRIYANALALPLCLATVRLAGQADRILFGAQNAHYEPEGAYTGEISLPMLIAEGVRSVLIGHSERRHIFGETDALLAQKAKAVLTHGLELMFCLGETRAQREAGQTQAVLSSQHQALAGLESAAVARQLVLAYEPVWAIGTGLTATTGQAAEAHRHIRSEVERLWPGLGAVVPILYGGSVKPQNTGELGADPDIDGVLVGGASLAVESWCDIVKGLQSR